MWSQTSTCTIFLCASSVLCAPQTACLKALWSDRAMWYAKLRLVYLQVFWISVGRIGPHPAISLGVRGHPAVLKLLAVPAYVLTMKNVHTLSIRHLVFGCLEGNFAMRQLHVLLSRATNPQHCQLAAGTPNDLIDGTDVLKLFAGSRFEHFLLI